MALNLGNETSPPTLTVSALNTLAKDILEANFPLVWVEGELSNFTAAYSGHWYFTLKDQKSQVRCAMFKGKRGLTFFEPKDGMQVRVQARVSLYAPRGDYQLIVQQMEEAGLGDLHRAFEALKKKLSGLGWFDESIKKPLPAFPERIGLITSAKGAAIRDTLTTLERRYPAAEVYIYPTLVQGEKAPKGIANAIQSAVTHNHCDVLIIGRGGGSLEDLWAFNEEIVAKAIYDCPLPTISAVGHEVDVTIADFVADVRAPTPTAAAELVSPDSDAWIEHCSAMRLRLAQIIQRRIERAAQQLDYLQNRLIHPRTQLGHQQEQCIRLKNRLALAWKKQYTKEKHHYGLLIKALDLLSPLTTLARGYSIVHQEKRVITSVKQVKKQSPIQITLSDGQITCIPEEG